MDIKTLKELGVCSINGTVPAAATYANENYTNDEVSTAFSEGLKELCPDRRAFRKNKADIYTLYEEVMDETLPAKVISIMGNFAEVRNLGQNEKVTFKKKVGKNRAKSFVTKVGLSGKYETFRLDTEGFEVPATAIGGAANVDIERMYDGHESINDYFNIVLEGMEDTIYEMVQEALLAAKDSLPTANYSTMTDSNDAALREMISLVKAYGQPTIFCTEEFASRLANFVYIGGRSGAANVYISDKDVDEIRDKGYVGKIYGANVVILPQSFKDENNTQKVINPAYAYILPTNEKPVKIVFEGQTMVRDVDNDDWSTEIQTYKKVGVGLIANNNWGIIKNTDIEG